MNQVTTLKRARRSAQLLPAISTCLAMAGVSVELQASGKPEQDTEKSRVASGASPRLSSKNISKLEIATRLSDAGKPEKREEEAPKKKPGASDGDNNPEEKDKEPSEGSAAKNPLEQHFTTLLSSVENIDASEYPCKIEEEAIGCKQAAKQASGHLKLVRKQLVKEIQKLRKAKENTKLEAAIGFGESLSQLRSPLRELAAADDASAAQDALASIKTTLERAQSQLKELQVAA